MHNMETLIKDEWRIRTEKGMLRVALTNCSYPEWDLKEREHLDKRQKRKEEDEEGQDEKNRPEKCKKAFVVLP